MADESPAVTTAAPLPEEGLRAARARSIHKLRQRVLSSSAIMLLSSMFVGGVNLIYNFAVAHVLGADQFGHASVVYTLLMLLSSVTLIEVTLSEKGSGGFNFTCPWLIVVMVSSLGASFAV